MEIREALRTHSPSLLLQRAAADEIAKLDRTLSIVRERLDAVSKAKDLLSARIVELEEQLSATQETP